MKIIPRKTYRIKGGSKYFEKKYGTPNPLIEIEDTDTRVFGRPWFAMIGNPACTLFAVRTVQEFPDASPAATVYYGKVKGLGELVWADELEELES